MREPPPADVQSGGLLGTPRLILREVVAADADVFDAYMMRELYWRHLPIDPPTPRSVRAFVEQCVCDQASVPRPGYFLAAIERGSGLIIGEGILHIRSERWCQGEIGWGVDPARAGQGFATEIGAAMLGLAFDLHRVYARCRVGHAASAHIMEKLGMREEGVLRENVFARGAWWSSLQASILADEWRAKQ